MTLSLGRVAPCPVCPEGELRVADLDPAALLEFPVRFVWRCGGCGHEEVRSDEV